MSANAGPGPQLMILLATLLVAFGPTRAWSDPEPEMDLDLAHSQAIAGNEAYESGRWAEAVVLYERALSLGLDHPTVHFNLGNALYKDGQLGRAIASYLRAQRLDPRNRSIRTNLERAQSQIRDRELSPDQIPGVLLPFVWVYRMLSLNEWAMVFWFALLTLIGALVLGQWTSGPSRGRRPVGTTALIVALISLSMLLLQLRSQLWQDQAVMVVEEVDVRSGPGSDYNLAFRVHEGLVVEVAEERGEWARIDLGGELVGWVPQGTLERI